jgi:hypothetical protein
LTFGLVTIRGRLVGGRLEVQLVRCLISWYACRYIIPVVLVNAALLAGLLWYFLINKR